MTHTNGRGKIDSAILEVLDGIDVVKSDKNRQKYIQDVLSIIVIYKRCKLTT